MSHDFHVDDLFPLDLHDTILVGLITRPSLHTQFFIPSVLFFASITGVCAYSYTSIFYPEVSRDSVASYYRKPIRSRGGAFRN